MLTGRRRKTMEGDLVSGYYLEPTILFGEEIFGPALAVATFNDMDEARALVNDSDYGLRAIVWSRDINTTYRMGHGIQAGRVWTNCCHIYLAHAAFDGYKQSGIGLETHKMMLEHYQQHEQQTKWLLVSYADSATGLF